MRPFENRLQDIITSLHQGLGLKLIRIFLFLCFLFAVFGFYIHSQFRGLNNVGAMEYAQLARNLAAGKGFTTSCIRPADMWYLERHSGPEYKVHTYPDIRHAPVFPTLLALGFKIVRPSFAVESGIKVFRPEKRVIIPICVFFSMATGLLVFLMARRLFDSRVAMISVLIYFLSEAVLAHSISGLPISLLAFFTMAASYAALISAMRKAEGLPFAGWFPPFLLSALLCAVSFLTRYSMVVLVPVISLFLGLGFEPASRLLPAGRDGGQARLPVSPPRPPEIWQWKISLAFLLIFVIAVSPWLIRNKKVSGGIMGLAPYSMLQDSLIYEDDSFDRQIAPRVGNIQIGNVLKGKLMSNFSRLYDVSLRTLGNGLIICFFLVSFFHRFSGGKVNLFRWCLALALFLMMLAVALCGENSIGMLDVFLPMIIVYGTAFFFVILERLEFTEPEWNVALTWGIVLLSALPTIFTVSGPRARVPYPPYFPPFISYVCNFLDSDEAMCTDIPWATAWYGNRNSILLPLTLDDFYEISDKMPVKGLYLTTETGDRPYTSSLATGTYRSWLPVLNRMVAKDFPLAHGIALPPGRRDQIFLTDRIRWKQRRQSNLAEGEEEEFEVKARE